MKGLAFTTLYVNLQDGVAALLLHHALSANLMASVCMQILLEMLLADDRISDGIRSMLLGFLDLQPFQRLCQGLLPHVTDADLLEIAEHLLPAATPNTVSGGPLLVKPTNLRYALHLASGTKDI